MPNTVAQKITLFCILSLFLFGCSSTPKKQTIQYTGKLDTPTASKPLSKQESSIYKKLNTHYQRWRGTPYELGGMNKGGIDCSGFVHVAFRDAFGMKLPRTTEALSRHGNKIKKNQLRVGDLVFFRTGRKQQHVGIYIGNKHFIHASTSNGVMKSTLTNPYWIKHYWKSTRLLSN